MSSPEERKEQISDLQQRYVFGNNSVVKPQTRSSVLEDAEPQEPAEHYSEEMLCLSRTGLKHVSECILKNNTLKYLYLQGNQLSSVPGSLFISLPNLQWLDLRNNQIVSLPAEIGLHRSLKTLVLEGNPISELPVELGYVITLNGLNLRYCPISFPPRDIVHQGVQGILQFLRSNLARRELSTRKAPPVSFVEAPAVEKLQLSELMESSVEEQDESVDEDELQKFKELKEKMILLDKAELGSVTEGDRNLKSRLPPITKRKKATTKASEIPGVLLFDTQRWKKPEERTPAAMKELQEKQTILEQRRKSHEALRNWRTQAKITQEKKMSVHKQRKKERQNKSEEAEADDVKHDVEEAHDTLHRQTSTMSIQDCEETRSARELQRQIRAHAEKMQRRRYLRGTSSEQMAAAEQDVEEMGKLQRRLLEGKRNPGRDSENCFTIFNGDTWPSYLYK